VQGGFIISQVRQSSGAKLHIKDAEPSRGDRVITMSLIDGRCDLIPHGHDYGCDRMFHTWIAGPTPKPRLDISGRRAALNRPWLLNRPLGADGGSSAEAAAAALHACMVSIDREKSADELSEEQQTNVRLLLDTRQVRSLAQMKKTTCAQQ